MVKLKTIALAGLAGALLAGPVLAATEGDEAAPQKAKRQCFQLSDWQGWSAPDKNTLYMKVRNRDVYRVDLSWGTNQLTSPGSYLISTVRGIDTVCAPLDLDLKVADGSGFAMPIRAKTITKLTPEEIAALPKKDRP
ncbi:DUF6491 family protein [Caulobacter hibisci]|uniref:Invasion associated locus B family protein n=1 Tax=Caulobacter hibisci TaxID=2035993 RepID=A0ABS0T548_9CAUL|nr:DUF6491 family protein [Caulobacter hibisci]MBI1686023.1 hypothetical protein [Caulobacter hibisci]